MKFKICRLSEVDDASYRKWYREADSDRRSRVIRMKKVQAQKQSLCADGLAREMLAENTTASAIRFSRSEKGKPEALNSPLHFSLSHSGEFVLCAVSEDEIGADLQVFRPVCPSLICRVCTEEEKEFIGTEDRLFFQVWTSKEALAKYYGDGLTGDLKKLAVVHGRRLLIPGLQLHSELTDEYALSIVYKT